jgi:hypothetical protein
MTATRDKKWLPERGFDPLMRRYICDGCKQEFYLARGRKFKVASSLSEPMVKRRRSKKDNTNLVQSSGRVTVVKEFNAVMVTP